MTISPEAFKAIKVTDDVYWVGAIDWEISDFHGYSTGRGTTYNAFLILSDKITLVDTVKRPFLDEMLSRIASVVEPGEIDYIVSNHSEMDHSGCLPEAIRAVHPEKVFASEMGVKALSAHFHLQDRITAVKDGEKLSLGNRTLLFLETRMLHWPDSMMSYLIEEEILFSQDGFGMHLASEKLYADEIDWSVLYSEASKYYANILLPYSPLVLKLAEKARQASLVFRIIAPDHGPLWRKDPEKIVGLYLKWAEQRPTRKAAVVFDTMWGSTALLARAIGEGLKKGGAEVKLLPLKKTARSEVATELLDAGALIVGSPTINNGIFPTLADVLTYLHGLKPKNLVGSAFGSYGWSGEAVKHLEERLAAMKVEVVRPGLKVLYVPTSDDLKAAFETGEAVGKKLSSFSTINP